MAERVNFCGCGRPKDGKAKTCRKCYLKPPLSPASSGKVVSLLSNAPEAVVWRRERIFDEIRQAAIEDRMCPSNPELAVLCGYTSDSVVSQKIGEMARQGRLSVERVGAHHRVITFPDGFATRDPREHIRDIAFKASFIFDMPEDDICGRSRFREHVRARQAVCAVASEEGLSTLVIGSVLGLDHTTVLYARQVSPGNAARDSEYSERLNELRWAVRGEAPMMEAAE